MTATLGGEFGIPAYQLTSCSVTGSGPMSGDGEQEGFDPVDEYFACITTCSLDDGECITVCTEQLRSHA